MWGGWAMDSSGPAGEDRRRPCEANAGPGRAAALPASEVPSKYRPYMRFLRKQTLWVLPCNLSPFHLTRRANQKPSGGAEWVGGGDERLQCAVCRVCVQRRQYTFPINNQ